MSECLKFFCMGEDETINFLEETLKAQEIINELTGKAQTKELLDLLSKAYDSLDEVLSPICPTCEIRAKKFITSPAQLYDSAMAELPGGTRRFWTKDWYCPKCRHIVASGQKWWDFIQSHESKGDTQ